jgi:8-oxo-dGTP pyrophosphatase MutT (NUDIX family)
MSPQPTWTSPRNGRTFACSPAAVLVFVINERQELLLLSSQTHAGRWEVINGGVEAGETVLAAALREAREEAGDELVLRPLGTVHTSTHAYDDEIRTMVSVAFVMACDGGEAHPGDDMAGSDVWWASLDELEAAPGAVCVPAQHWMCRRAVQLYRLWREEPTHDLEHAVPLDMV